MSLQLTRLRLHDFRNYGDFTLDDIDSLTVFVGPNAVGKTNIVEGIQLITALESFRASHTSQLIRWDRSEASVSATLEDGARSLDMMLVLDDKGRHYRLNGKQRSRVELQGQLPAVLFTPDDLQLVKGGPDFRRSALDSLGIQVSKNYLAVKRDYDKLIRQKNRLLKEETVPGYLASVNEVLAKVGSQLFRYRLRMVKELGKVLGEKHRETTASNDEVTLEYISSIANSLSKTQESAGLSQEEQERYLKDRFLVEEQFHQALAARADEEHARKLSLVGPHRDKPLFFLNGRPAADFASQGQQRSIVIAYKLSELKLVEQLTYQKPLLLLDDVMSELDATRRETLTRYVSEAVQTFITTTNLDYFNPELLEGANIIRLG